MTRPIENSVIVVTGASSGIGRATALELARRGASVVLAARRVALLDELAQECQSVGSKALVVPTDVTDEAAVQALGQQALGYFGRFDAWINNAGVIAFGRFEDIPSKVFNRVIETNFLGYVYGARVALQQFYSQDYGILINNASVDSQLAAPYLTAYSAAKFAVRGFSESLREEVETLDKKDIHICTVKPATIDTPLFQHAANYTGRAIKALPPVYDVETAVKTFVGLVEKPQREVFVGTAGRMLATMHAIAPGAAEQTYAHQVERGHLSTEQSAPPTEGNLFTPMPEKATTN
ncbi:short-chain dehydrogenase [Reticulibacter mediterranei]|uniref:Short-chain dehydrogenase n=1 Tax=Reticulibacter mediterranei TaxID=2778369 RepID=A0A8J3IWD4_9CHLR|nr:SDR family oxidoreductase [Reticulibacter mediterranei]GHO99733.1 short-chain dehydrogenase [Reticulibacter mediterranei]